MITQRAINYAKVLGDLAIPFADVENTKGLLSEASIVAEVLDNPVVGKEEKQNVVKSLFPENMWNFMRLLCEHNSVSLWSDIFETYEEMELEKQNKIKATLRYAIEMDEEDIAQIKEMICKKYNKAGVELELIHDPSLIGGMVLEVQGTEYDKSIKGTLEELQKTLVRR